MLLRSTLTCSGAFRNLCVSFSISGGMVAEKNSVWRAGESRPQIRSISGIKPISSIRSASSMTNTSTAVSSSLPRPKWSSSRPGVAISTSAPRSSLRNCSSNDTPPISSATVSLCLVPSSSNACATCAANSRVGSRISERGIRARARPRSSFVSIGSTNDAVLPVPVCAMPITSRPSMAIGIALAWIGVGSVNPAAWTASRTLSLKPRSVNVIFGLRTAFQSCAAALRLEMFAITFLDLTAGEQGWVLRGYRADAY